MKRHFKYGLILIALFFIHACGSGTRLQDYETKNEKEKEIKNLLIEFAKARNDYDVQKLVSYLSDNAKIGLIDNRIYSKSEFASTFKASDLESWGKLEFFNPEFNIKDDFAEAKINFKESLLNRGFFIFKINRQNNRWLITEYMASR